MTGKSADIQGSRISQRSFPLLYFFFFSALFSVFSVVPVFAQQTPSSTPDLEASQEWLTKENRLRQKIARGSSEDKRDALFEIRNLRAERASRLAIPALKDSNELVRATAASSVVFLPGPEAAQALLPLLNDKAEFVRREAAYALGQIGDWSATQKLTGVAKGDKSLEVRSAAVVALGGIGDHFAINTLDEILRRNPIENEEFLRRSAARSIGQIAQFIQTGTSRTLTPQNFLPAKYKEYLDRKHRDLVQAFPEFAAARDRLSGVLQNEQESDDTRREAAYALGAIGDASSTAILESNLQSSDPFLAEISREALLKIMPSP